MPPCSPSALRAPSGPGVTLRTFSISSGVPAGLAEERSWVVGSSLVLKETRGKWATFLSLTTAVAAIAAPPAGWEPGWWETEVSREELLAALGLTDREAELLAERIRANSDPVVEALINRY